MTLACEPYHHWRIRPGTNTEVTETYRANILLDDPEFSRRLLANETNNRRSDKCQKDANGLIEALHVDQLTNPDKRPFADLLAACYRKHGVAPPNFTAKDMEPLLRSQQDLAAANDPGGGWEGYDFDPGTNPKASDCFSNPTGQSLQTDSERYGQPVRYRGPAPVLQESNVPKLSRIPSFESLRFPSQHHSITQRDLDDGTDPLLPQILIGHTNPWL